MNEITVANVTTQVLTHDGRKVCTTKQLAGFYGCSDENIQKNYERNIDRFVEGVHFVKLEGSMLRQFKASLTDYLSVTATCQQTMLKSPNQ